MAAELAIARAALKAATSADDIARWSKETRRLEEALARARRNLPEGAGGCFVAGTKVATTEGKKNIEEIKEGDYVLAADAESGKPIRQRVTQIYNRESGVLLEIEIKGETIKATPEHPF